MTITYKLIEEFDGTRSNTMPDADTGTDITTVNEGIRDIMVQFLSSGEVITERLVNVVFDSEGEYDAEATAVRISEVADGVATKYELGMYNDTSSV
ncbi:MAG TPA: hypothetical protein EYP92_00280 [Candidatus Thioglobus sp.]|jgi:hypothetical protein|nr:hypothetical protein [Candidatus Thioglobus sp.]